MDLISPQMAARRRTGTMGLLVLGSVALSACGFKLLDVGPPPQLYDLQPRPAIEAAAHAEPWQLIVEEPAAQADLNTDQIMVRPSKYEIKYYSGARWADRAPVLVQAGLVEAFESSAAVPVAKAAIGLRGAYSLKSDIREYAAVLGYGETTPTIQVRINFMLVRQPTAQIVDTKLVSVDQKAQSGSMEDVIEAFQIATNKTLEQAVPWVLAEAKTDYVTSGKAARAAGKAGTRAPQAQTPVSPAAVP